VFTGIKGCACEYSCKEVNFMTGENGVIRYSKDKNIFVITVLSHAMHSLRSKHREIRTTVH
jgi:hypothetical protein